MASAPSSTMRRAVVALLGIVLLSAMAGLWLRARAASQVEMSRQLSAGQALQQQALSNALDSRLQASTQLAEDPAFVAYLLAAQARSEAGDASIRDLLEERAGALGAGSSVLISAGGTTISGVGDLRSAGRDVERWRAVLDLLSSAQPSSGWWARDGQASMIAVAPLRQGPLLEGALVLGFPVDQAAFTALFKDSALDGHLVVDGQNGAQVLVSTAGSSELADGSLAALLAGNRPAGSADAATAVALPALAQPIWLVSSLPDAARSAVRKQERILLASMAGVLVLSALGLAWLWRNEVRGRADLPNVGAANDEQETAGARLSADQQRSTVLLAWLERLGENAAARKESGAQTAAPLAVLGDRYQLISQQGESALARIVRALDVQLDRVVLVFILRSGTPRDTARSLRITTELGAVGALHHRNLVTIQRITTVHATSLVVLEDVNGVTLRDALDKLGAMPVEAGILVAKRLCSALVQLHRTEMLLRCIDPAQVIFQPDGVVKLLPLALAAEKQVSANALAQLTAEQWLVADRRGDLRAFAELVVEMLLGRPLDGKAAVSQSAGWNALPIGLRSVLERCLRSDPAQRYRSADELMTELERL